MNSMQPDQLSREDITRTLNERHLKIPNVELLSYEELLRIYKTFALPLEQRVPKNSMETAVPHLHPSTVAMRPFSQDYTAHAVFLNDHTSNGELDPHLLQKTKYLKLSFNTIANSAKKRQSSYTMNGFQEATPAKRKPIIWP